MWEENFSKIQVKNNICIDVFCYENKVTFPIYISDQKFENSVDLLLVSDENKSNNVKDFGRSMFHKTRNKNKKYFCKSCLQCFGSKIVLTEYKEICLSINDTQSVRLKKETIKFKNYFKQIPAPFKVYADFECNLKFKTTFLVVLLTSLFVLMINLVSQLLFTEVKMLLLNLLKQCLKSTSTVKK